MGMPEPPYWLLQEVTDYLKDSGPVHVEDLADNLGVTEYRLECALAWLQRHGLTMPVSEDGFVSRSESTHEP